MFDRGPSPLSVVVGVGFAASLRQERQKANRRQMRQAVEVRTYPLTLVLERAAVFLAVALLFQESFLSHSVRLSLPLFILLFVAITALPREWRFLLCQQFLPPLSLHIQDVSFRKHELIPPVWLLFAFIQLQWANSYLLPMLGQLKLRGKTFEHCWHLCVCSSVSLSFFFMFMFFSLEMTEVGVCIWKLSFNRGLMPVLWYIVSD